MSLIDVVLSGLAARAAIDGYLAALGDDKRARLEASEMWLAKLFSCSFCLAYYVATAFVFILFWLAQLEVFDAETASAARIPIYILAAAAIARFVERLEPAILVAHSEPPEEIKS